MSTAVSESGSKFGPWQGLWLMLGYLAGQLLGNFLVYLGWGAGLGLQALLHHRRPSFHPEPDAQVMAWGALLGFVVSALWALFYVRRRARPLLRRGEATAIAWRAPKFRAYAAGVLVALSAVVFASLMVAALPPDTSKLTGPMSKLLEAPGFPRMLVQFLAVLGAPLVEEFVFRGAFFAALVRGWGVRWAGIVTTLLFMVLHAPDKASWWPGFLVVGFLGAMLVMLRLRYKSLWPGMLAHFLYNSSFLLLP
jgi:membrane protease YdiL (CAAX protease family)